MKKIFFLVLLIQQSSLLFSQNHNILFSENAYTHYPHVVFVDDDRLLISKNTIELNYFDSTFVPDVYYANSEIILYNLKTKKTEGFYRQECNDNLFKQIGYILKVDDNHVYLTEVTKDLNYQDSNFYSILKFDLNLNLLDSYRLFFDGVNRPLSDGHFVLNKNNELVCIVSEFNRITTQPYFVFKFNLDDGAFIDSLKLIPRFAPHNVYFINEDCYLHSKYYENRIVKINSDFEIDTVIQFIVPQGNQIKNIVTNNKMTLVSHDPHPTERLILMDTNGIMDTIVEIPLPSNMNLNQYMAGFWSLDTIGSTVYFSNNIHVDNSVCFAFYSQPPCANYFSLHRVDTSGQHYWSNYYGGDYAYHVNNVVATPDSGCLVVFSFNRGLPTDFTHSIRYLKVDKHGNPELNYLKDLSNLVGLEEVVAEELPMLKLYPNPASNVLNVSHNIKGIQRLEVYNMQGQLVLQQSSTGFEQSFMIDKLPSGQYVLRLLGKEKVFSYGFVKGM